MEIGGEFCFADIGAAADGEVRVADLLDGWSRRYPVTLLSSGRSAYLNVWLTLRHAGRELDAVLLPSYLCYSILMPFRRMGIRVEYYRVDADLSPDWKDLERKAEKLGGRAAAVIVNYFGFPESGNADAARAIDRIRQTGMCVVYDATHSLLNYCPWPVEDSCLDSAPVAVPLADVCITSLRKALPVVDGAAVVWLGGARPAPALRATAERIDSYFSSRALAMVLKASYVLDDCGIRQNYLNLYDQAEAALDGELSATGAMSGVSRSIIKRLDVERIRRARRENYAELVKELHGQGVRRGQEGIRLGFGLLFPELPDGVVPLGCPVVADERDALREHLATRGILTQVLWQSPPEVPREEFPESWLLSQRILVLPCDQRYSAQHMAEVARAVRQWLSSR